MKNLFSRCGKLRRRLRKHKLTTKAASNFGAFHLDHLIFGESYRRTTSDDEYGESKQRETTRGISSTVQSCETGFYSRKHSTLNLDDSLSKTTKEFTYEMEENIISLLNLLYADEFVEDAFFLEVTIILFESKESCESFKLQENHEDLNKQNENENELQAWIDMMSEKIYCSGAEKVIARQGKLPGPVGKPVIGGCTMRKMASNRNEQKHF